MQHIFNKAAALCYFSTNKSFYKLKKKTFFNEKAVSIIVANICYNLLFKKHRQHKTRQ